MSRRFVLLDRDGTLNEEVDHLADPEELKLIAGVPEALVLLRSLGLGLVVVTNQAHVGRGLLTEGRLAEINDRLRELLAAEGAEVDAIYHCPHAPEAECECRKPRPGMVVRAAADFGFEESEAFVVGDHASDMGMGRVVGATTIHVRTGHGEEELVRGAGDDADFRAADLVEAAAIIRGLIEGDGR